MNMFKFFDVIQITLVVAWLYPIFMLYNYWIHNQEYGSMVTFIFLGFLFMTHFLMNFDVTCVSNAGSWTPGLSGESRVS